jgi:hypothetical protein
VISLSGSVTSKNRIGSVQMTNPFLVANFGTISFNKLLLHSSQTCT